MDILKTQEVVEKLTITMDLEDGIRLHKLLTDFTEIDSEEDAPFLDETAQHFKERFMKQLYDAIYKDE